jgi:glycosyltransferase involved in cell wall biosynthesis
MKKILIFSTTYFPYVGGAEVAVREITDRIIDIEFDMITLRFDSGLPRKEKIGNVNVYRVGFTKKEPTMDDLVRFPMKLNKYLLPFSGFFKSKRLDKKNRYDGIWSIMASYAGFAALFFKFTKRNTPFLLTLQEGDDIGYIKKRTRWVSGLYGSIFKSADHIQTISNFLAEYARTMGFKGKLDVVPNGVDFRHFSRSYAGNELEELKHKLGKKENDIFLITTSRLVKKNAVDDVIMSLAFLPENVKFLILGSGPDEVKLKMLAKDRGLGERIKFLGYVGHDELPKYLKISDIFIRPSLSEGLGNSFLEAMAAGLPVIATEVGGIPDFLFDPEKNPGFKPTGLFCNVNDPKSIAEKIKLFLENNELKAEIISNAMDLVRTKYDWAGICKEMETIFKTIKPE